MQAKLHHPWEAALLLLAHEAHNSTIVSTNYTVNRHLLESAYKHCAALTAYHSRSFHVASALLPTEKRRAIRALYAFCRVTDDIVDQSAAKQLEQLETWRACIASATPPADELVAVAWADIRARYQIPWHYTEQLIDGVARDLHQTRYASFAELAAYSYGVASTVGLMSMHIVGYAGSEAIPYAIKLGVALQITNILRDIAEDWQRGRLYLPQDELASFGIDEAEIATKQITQRWRDFMCFQVERNRQLYREAYPGIAMLDVDGRFAIAAAAELYQGILDEIEMHNYDIFSRRVQVSKWGKLRRLPGIWWRSRTVRAE